MATGPNTVRHKRSSTVKLPLTMTRLELAEHLRVSPKTIDRWARAGRVPPPLAGGPRRWATASILKWLELPLTLG